MYLLHQGKPSKERQQGSEATKAAFSGMLPENSERCQVTW